MNQVLVACLVLAAAGDAGAAERLSVGADILGRAERIRSPELDYAVDFRIDVTDSTSVWQTRSATYAMVAAGKDHSLVLMRDPEQFYPGTLLIDRGYYWMLLPRSDKAFQLSPRHVLNGDVSNGDLARGNLLAFYEAELVGEAVLDGIPCYEVELTRNRNLGLYSRILAAIEIDTFRPRRFRYVGNTGALLKTAHYTDYRQGELGLRAMRIEVENHARPAERTTLTFSRLRRFDTAGLEFTREGLRAFRDAALELRDAHERQATLEEITARLRAATP